MHTYTCDKRHENCPLIEVPEPHGRLGDLDALQNKIVDYIADGYAESPNDLSFMFDSIRDAPTIIPSNEETLLCINCKWYEQGRCINENCENNGGLVWGSHDCCDKWEAQ